MLTVETKSVRLGLELFHGKSDSKMLQIALEHADGSNISVPGNVFKTLYGLRDSSKEYVDHAVMYDYNANSYFMSMRFLDSRGRVIVILPDGFSLKYLGVGYKERKVDPGQELIFEEDGIEYTVSAKKI